MVDLRKDLKLDNKSNQEAILNQYLNTLEKINNYSPNTIKSYKNDITQYLNEENKIGDFSNFLKNCSILTLMYETKFNNEFKSLKILSKHTHGTGCTLASAIATNIALRRDIPQCVETSINYVQTGIKNAPNFGQGNGPIRHF